MLDAGGAICVSELVPAQLRPRPALPVDLEEPRGEVDQPGVGLVADQRVEPQFDSDRTGRHPGPIGQTRRRLRYLR